MPRVFSTQSICIFNKVMEISLKKIKAQAARAASRNLTGWRLFIGAAVIVCAQAVSASAQSTPPQNPPPQQNPANQTPAPQPQNPNNQQPTNTEPQPGVRQQPPTIPQQPAPQTQTLQQPNAQPAPGAPAGGNQPGAPGVPQTPASNVGVSPGIAPAELPADPPPIAPNFEAPSRPLPSAERVGVDIANQLPLSLEEAISLALQNNNDIDSAQIDVRIAEFNLRAARGVYDPVLASESYYESRTTPTASTIGGAGATGSVTQKDITGAFGARGFSPFAGGSYTFDFNNSRITTSNQNATLNPQYPTSLVIGYTQPLWRGLRFDNNRRNIEIARKNLSLTDAQFRQRAIDVIAQVQQAYWDLTFSLRNLQVQIDAVKQARQQLESNQRLVAKGALAPIEIIAATTQVTTFEQNVYTAQEAVTRAENTLKTLMLKDRTNEIWTRPLTPVSEINLEPPRVDLVAAVGDALKNRPEIAQLTTSGEINKIDERYFRDQTKPQIDLVGTYTASGLAGAINTARQTNTGTSTNTLIINRINQLSAPAGLQPLPLPTTTGAPPENLVGGYLKSLGNLAGQDFPTYRVGVVVSLPLFNRTAEANLGRTLAQAGQIRNQRLQQEQIIEADVRNAVQTLRSAEARLQSAAAARDSAEKQFESEQRQFRAGTTTFYLVLQRQTELLSARGRELQAQTDLNKAIAIFQRSTGTTLSANNVSVKDGALDKKLVFQPITAFRFSAVGNLVEKGEAK